MYTSDFILDELIVGCRNGLKFDKIVHNFINNDKKPVPHDMVDKVKKMFEEEKKRFNNFNYTQQVLDLEFILDITTGEYHLVDIFTKETTPIKIAAVENAFNKGAFQRIKERKLYSVFLGWNPDENVFKYKESLVESINLYKPAKWQLPYFFEGVEVPNTPMPKVYVDFFKHLTGNELSLDYLMAFTAATVQRGFKPQNYCVLTGIQGTGKGVYFQIMQQLLDPANTGYTEAVKIIDSKFNAFARNKKLIFIDELKIKSPGEEDILKPFVNDTIAIEAKGVDSLSVKNYASLLIASNDVGEMRISTEDRRFCFVDPGNIKLADYVNNLKNGHNVSSYIKKVLLDPENIKQFGEFLLNYKYDENLLIDMLESDTRRTLKEETASDWVTSLLANVCPKNKGKKLKLGDVQEQLMEVTNSSKVPGRRQWVKISKDYPGYFEVIRIKETNGEQNYYIQFATTENMPTYLKESK
jgi:hypothetical protein